MEPAHQEIMDLIGAYCLAALEPREKARLEEHLGQGCRECEVFLQEMQSVVAALPYAAEPQNPPSHVKEKIFSEIRADGAASVAAVTETRHEPAKRPRNQLDKARIKWTRISWGLAFAVVIIVGGFGWYIRSLRNEISRLEDRLMLSERLVQELRTELVKQEKIIRVVQSPDIRMVTLNGLESAPSSSGKVFWNEEKNEAIFYAFGLPQLPPDKDYQLWMIRGNQPVDAGVFSTDSQGTGVVAIDSLPDSTQISAFAVTLEPKGGAPQPTGQMVLLGPVTKG